MPKTRRRRRASADLPIPAPDIFPIDTVRVPWSVRLGLARNAVTVGAGGMGPRRLLLRDTAAMLVVLAVVVLIASQPAGTPVANGEGDPALSSSGGVGLPIGTLDLLSPTPEVTPILGETPRPTVEVTHSTQPPWCANPTCTVFVTPSPSPTPTPTPSPTPVPTPSPIPTPSPPTITSYPANPSGKHVSFSFTHPDAGVTFNCQIDGGGYTPCSSPKDYPGLSRGSHTFAVTATDAAGNTSGPASYTWDVA